jgi:Glycosyltransferase
MHGMRPHLLCIGGDDHALRIPFLLALRERGLNVSAAGTGGEEAFVRAGIDFHRYAMSRFLAPRTDRAAIAALSRLIGDLRPTIIQCFDTKPDILVPFAAHAAGRVPVVSTITGLGWLYSSRSPLALSLRPVFTALQRRASRLTTALVFQNRDDEAFFARRRLFGAADHRVIPGSGIDVERFDHAVAAGPSPAALRSELALGEAPVVMTVTRLTRQKGIATLLEAAAIVHRQAPDVRFLLVGPRESEGPLAIARDEIDRHAPYVRALGARADVPSLLQIADVFAFPTELREGVPRALMEACVAGRPCVTTQMPGCTDVIDHGTSGLVVPARSPARLAEAVLQLLRDRATARDYAARASAHVRKELNLDITVDRYAAVYEEILCRTGGAARLWPAYAPLPPAGVPARSGTTVPGQAASSSG